MLNPSIIAEQKTLAEIDAKILHYESILETSANEKSYTLDTTQGNQKVDNHKLSEISELLAVYMQAKSIKEGKVGAKMYSGNYTGGMQ